MTLELFRLPCPILAPDEGGGTPSAASSSYAGGSDASAPSGASSDPSDGGTPTPSGAKESAPTSTPAGGGLTDDSGDGAEDFSALGADLDDIEIPEVVVEATPPVVDAAPAPSPAPQTPPVVEPKPPSEAGSQQQPPAAAEPAKPVEAEPTLPSDPGPLARALQEKRAEVIDQLANTHYKLTPEEVTALQTDAVAAVPKLFAKAHVDLVSTFMTHMANLVPKMIDTHIQLTKASSEAEDAFYKANPALDKAQHGSEVTRLANLYRQANPKASLDDMIRDVGTMAVTTLKITPSAPTPPKPNGAKPAPFVPAAPGGGGPTQPPPDNPWDGLGRDFD